MNFILRYFNLTVNEMGSHWVLALLYLKNVLYWPEDDRLRSEHVAVMWLLCIYYITVLIYCCVLTVCNTLYKSYYRPGQAPKVPGGWRPQISRQSAHEGGKVVSPILLEAESTPGPWCDRKGLCQCEIPITPSGTEPANSQLVAQREIGGSLQYFLTYLLHGAESFLRS